MGIGKALVASRNTLFVLQSGIISSAGVLLILWLMAEYWPGVYVIGWYMNMIPVGAIAAGIAAASGYVIAAMWIGAGIPRAVMIPIFMVQIGVYIGAEYVEYRREWGNDSLSSFVDYFDQRSRSFRLVDNGGRNEPFNGYVLRILEMGGFAAPALFVPLFMSGMPRCTSCKGYRSTKQLKPLRFQPRAELGMWTDGSTMQDDESREARAACFRDRITELLLPLAQAIERDDAQAIRNALAALREQSDAETEPHCVIRPDLQYCAKCATGRLSISFRFQWNASPTFDTAPAIALGSEALRVIREGF